MLWKKLYGVQMCVQLHTRTTLYINMFIYLTSSLVMLHQQLYKIQLFISTFYFYFLVRLQIHIFVMKLFTIIIPRRKLCNSVLIFLFGVHCLKSNPNFHYITWNVEENLILHVIFRVVSRFPRYISCYIAESRLSLGQCMKKNISQCFWVNYFN